MTTSTNVRGIDINLVTYNRSLELCARFNYETENLDFIDKIPENAVMFDLGACEGRFSIYAAKKGIKVFSFEPEAKNFKAFKENILANNIDETKLIAINAGVGRQNGTANMKIGQPWEGGHQKVVDHGEVRNDLDFEFKESQEIKIFSIDSFIKEHSLSFPDYMKIDIDGSEIPFLEGAEETLNSKTLKAIIFELNEVDPNFDRIIQKLKLNYFTIKEKFQVPNEANLFNYVFIKP